MCVLRVLKVKFLRAKVLIVKETHSKKCWKKCFSGLFSSKHNRERRSDEIMRNRWKCFISHSERKLLFSHFEVELHYFLQWGDSVQFCVLVFLESSGHSWSRWFWPLTCPATFSRSKPWRISSSCPRGEKPLQTNIRHTSLLSVAFFLVCVSPEEDVFTSFIVEFLKMFPLLSLWRNKNRQVIHKVKWMQLNGMSLIRNWLEILIAKFLLKSCL